MQSRIRSVGKRFFCFCEDVIKEFRLPTRVMGYSVSHIVNGVTMLIYKFSGPAVGFFIFAISIRKYGPELVGKYAFALALTQVVAPLLVNGIDPMLVRELVRRPEDKLQLLGSAFLLILLSTLCAVTIPLLYVLVTSYNDTELIYMVVGVSAALLPNCALVMLSFFRAQSRIFLASCIGLSGVLLGAFIRLALVIGGKPLYYVTAAAILDPLVVGLLLLLFYRKYYGSVWDWRISRDWMKQLLQLSWPTIVSGFVATIFFRISHLMLESMSTFDQLGYYAIAFQMFTVLNFLPGALVGVIYPRLVQLHKTNMARYTDAVRTLYRGVTVGGFVICGAVWIFIGPIIAIAFGPKSAPVAPIAAIMAIANLFTFSSGVRSQVIYIEHRPILHVYGALLGLAVLCPLNLVLIPHYGAIGAAVSVAIASGVSGVLSSWVFKELRTTALDQTLAFVGIKRHVAL
jgi:O-antigen/teichoic acid export membrane protein